MYQQILVPVDGSATSKRGLAEAIQLARQTQGHLRLIHCIDGHSYTLAMEGYGVGAIDWLEDLRSDGKRILAEAQAAAADAGVDAGVVLYDNFNGSVAELVTREAASWPADLIVIGTHGRRGVGRMFLGSSAEQILRMAPVPVLLVRAPDGAPSQGAPASKGYGLLSGAAALS